MMKRISAVMVALLMMVCTITPAFALSGSLIDEAHLLSSSESDDMKSKLNDASLHTGWDIIIYTNENNVSKYSMEDYCNNYYDNASFGYSGVMLTVDMASREMFVLTKGDAMEYFTDQRVNQILDDIVYYLSDDEYVSACEAFINDVLYFYDEGIPQSGDYDNVYIAPEDSNDKVNPFVRVLKEYGILFGIVSVVVAVLAVVFTFLRYKNHGKSDTYDLEENSVTHLTQREDIFITKSISVTTISSSSGGSSGGGGGGGSSHGGGGRSF